MKSEKIKHLEFIQSAISRMTYNSFTIKGWSITLITGLFALSVFTDVKWTAILPIFPVISFWALDAIYLRQEKLFRELYDDARNAYINHSESFDLLNMNIKPYEKKVKNSFCLMFSRTVIWFHGTICILVIAGIVYLTFFKM